MTKYTKDDSRKIRIEPNPYKLMKQKFKMKTRKLSGGQPVVDQEGRSVFVEQPAENLFRVPGTAKKISPSRTQNGINTGLNVLVDNPYKSLEIYSPAWEIILKSKDKVLLQHVLEYECGYPIDYLTHRIPEGAVASDKVDKKFFETPESKIHLDGGVTFLDLSNPLHKIYYYVLLAHNKVANTWEDLMDGGNQDAEWYIVDDESKQKREKSKAVQTVEAGAGLHDLNLSTSNAIIDMTKVLELPEASDRNMSRDKAYNLLFNFFNRDTQSFTLFMEAYNLWKDAALGRDKFNALADLYNYQNQGLVSHKNGRYTWYKVKPGEPTETYTFNGKMNFVVEFLLSPANQENAEQLQEEYESKIR